MTLLRLLGGANGDLLNTNWTFNLIPSGVSTHLRGINQRTQGVNNLICGDSGVMLEAQITDTIQAITPIVSGTTSNLLAAGGYSSTGFLDSLYSIAAGVSGIVKGVGYNNAIFNLPTPGYGINACTQIGGDNTHSHFIVGASGYYGYRGFAANSTTAFTTLTSLTGQALYGIVNNVGSGYKPIAVGAGGVIVMNGAYQTTDFNMNLTLTSGTVQNLLAVGSASFGTGGINEVITAVGMNGVITSSLDSGFTWSVRSSPTTEHLRGVCGPAVTGNTSWVAVGDNGTILVSYDSINWSKVSTSITNNLNAIVRGVTKDYIIVGNNGSIYRMY